MPDDWLVTRTALSNAQGCGLFSGRNSPFFLGGEKSAKASFVENGAINYIIMCESKYTVAYTFRHT